MPKTPGLIFTLNDLHGTANPSSPSGRTCTSQLRRATCTSRKGMWRAWRGAVRRYASGAAAAEAAEGGLEVEDRRQYFTEEESLLVAMPLLLAAMPLLLVASSL